MPFRIKDDTSGLSMNYILTGSEADAEDHCLTLNMSLGTNYQPVPL